MKPFNSTLAGFGTTIFEVMSRLAKEHDTINLGQGFPDEEGPAAMLDVLADASRRFPNQYPPMMGVPELRQAVAACMDHKEILDIAFRGAGLPAENHHVSPIHPEYAELPPLKRDIEKAKERAAKKVASDRRPVERSLSSTISATIEEMMIAAVTAKVTSM